MASIFHGFWWILEAKLSQVGMENRAKIDQKAHGKYDEKKEGILETSWRPLGSSWRRLGAPKSMDLGWRRLEPAARGRGGGDAGATPRKDS